MNQTQMMNIFGLFLLTLGVALCAAFGARQSPIMFRYLQHQGTEKALGSSTKEALKAYNEDRAAAKLPPLDEMNLPTLKFITKASFEKQTQLKTTSTKQTIDQGDAAVPTTKWVPNNERLLTYLAELGQASGPHADALETKRRAWLDHEAKYQTLKLKNFHTQVPSPTDRIEGWGRESGIPFGLGIILIAVGAMIARKAQKAALSPTNDAKTVTLTDAAAFSAKLTELSKLVQDLSDNSGQISEPTVGDAESIKSTIEALQLSHFDPMIEARYSLQGSIGLGQFADIFSPLSSGERNLNRAWATLVDEHWSEALSALGRAALSIKRADDSLKAVLADTKSS